MNQIPRKIWSWGFRVCLALGVIFGSNTSLAIGQATREADPPSLNRSESRASTRMANRSRNRATRQSLADSSSPAETNGAGAAPEWSVVVPFELLPSGHQAIQLKLNGNGPFRVVFDTGAPSVMFSGDAAKGAGAIRTQTRAGMMGGYGNGRLRTVQFGDFLLHDVAADFRDHPTVQTLGEAQGGLEGLVGFPLLNPAKLTIDYSDQTIRFVPRMHGRKASEGDTQKVVRDAFSKRGPERDVILAPAALWGLEVRKPDDAQPGVEVLKVVPDSAAAVAGLQPGDRILLVNRRWTDTGADFYLAASFALPTREALLEIRRGEDVLELKLQPRRGL